MTHSTSRPVHFARDAERSRLSLAARLAREVDGEVLFDAASRGRYSTDASIYQVMPVGVVVPRTRRRGDRGDADRGRGGRGDPAARRRHLAVRPDRGRGAGDRRQQVPQSHGRARCRGAARGRGARNGARHAQRELRDRTASGIPVDVSTSAQATLGGMAGNNSCGSRSLAYGNMVDRVAAIDAWLPTGVRGRFDAATRSIPRDRRDRGARPPRSTSASATRSSRATPKVARNVAGYNLSHLASRRGTFPNLARLLVGSEGTLAWFEQIHIELAELPKHKALGVAHFPRFHDAMEAAQHIVKLGPCAVELVDRTMLDLALSNAAFAPVIRTFVKGEPRRDPARRIRRRRSRYAGAKACSGWPNSWATWASADAVVTIPDARRAEVALGRAQGGTQHHDVDEGRRKARVVHRGLRGAARAPRRIHGGASPRSSASTAPRAPGTRTPRWDACTCARCST